ncbi:S-layer homology domain-containing protein [Bacillus tuaregi]|uniref:S-layer homology domain-containing protein n=1 Tax=Bacillus tuaregi TaxID=1816695 RepID=UPI0008F8FF4B|nr:S-layer homology domain-containing protein [Bacillus tuaregi]
MDDYFILIDLDRDEIPELIGGHSYRMDAPVYFAITIKNGKIKNLAHKGDGIQDTNYSKLKIGTSAFNAKLYKNKQTGQYIYIGNDGWSTVADVGSIDYEISLDKDGTIFSKEISYYSGQNSNTASDDPTGDVPDFFTFNGKEVSKEEYEQQRKAYFSQLEEVNSKVISEEMGHMYDMENEKAIESGINQFINRYGSNLGEDLYASMETKEKKKLIAFMEQFIYSDPFDITDYDDADLLDWVNENHFLNITPFTLDYTSAPNDVRQVESDNGEKIEWYYMGFPKKEVDQYLFDLFGVALTKQKEYKNGHSTFPYFYEDPYYYFYSLEKGGPPFNYSPQPDKMYSIGNDLYYVEFSKWVTENIEWEENMKEYWLDPKENWTEEQKYRTSIEDNGYAILKKVNTDGKQTWNLVKYEGNGAQLLHEELALYQKQHIEDPNVVFDYKKIKSYKKTNEFVKHLDDTLTAMDGAKPNEGGNAAIREFIEYALQQESMKTVTGDDNKIVITGEHVEPVWNKVKTAQSEYQNVLQKHDITLQKEVDKVLRLNGAELHLDEPVLIEFDKSALSSMGEANKITFSLDGKQYAIHITQTDLEQAIAANKVTKVQFEKGKKQGHYIITFLDESNKSIEQMTNPLTFSLPAEDEYSTVFANYQGERDNWGAQYSSINNTLEFATKFSGEYEVQQNEVKIIDINDMDEKTKKAIQFMVSKGFFTLDNEKFNPDGLIDRNNFTMALVKMFFALDPNLKTTFTDVKADDAFYSYIASSQTNNIVEGFEDNTFRGNNNIPLEQVLALASRTLVEKKGYMYPEDVEAYLQFVDRTNISDWAIESTALAVSSGLIDGGGMLMPHKEITRSQAAEVLYNLFMLLYDVPDASIVSEDIQTKVADDAKPMSTTNIFLGIGVLIAIVVAAIMLNMKKKKEKNNSI